MLAKRRKVILIGGGGHARVIIDAIKNAKKFNIYGVIDPKLPKNTSVLDIPVIGSDEILPKIFKKGIRYAFISVGSIGNCEVRKKIYYNLKKIGYKLPVITHPKAIIAKSTKLQEGTFVAAGAIISPSVKIGKNAIINTRSSIDHDSIIGDFVHIAPGVTLSGGVRIGDETHIGTGANVIQDISIGRGCTVGAGTTVRNNMSDGQRNSGMLMANTYEKE